jgi:hypothetical protein
MIKSLYFRVFLSSTTADCKIPIVERSQYLSVNWQVVGVKCYN